MLGNVRVQAELAHIHSALSRVAASVTGKVLVEDLHRTTGGTTAALLWQSLYADCLRVVHLAVTAYGTIDDDKVKAIYDFVWSVARYFGNVTPSPYNDLAVIDPGSARAFLERYADDAGPFGGRAESRWPGYGLCRAADEFGEPEALRRYKQLMVWLIPAACQIGGVTEADLRRRGPVEELAELRRELGHHGEVAATTPERRERAFLEGTWIFGGVEQAASVFESDPFDVETLHSDTRQSFERMVQNAISTSQPTDGSRMLLVLGDAGAGKTHLLRGFRRYVQEFGRGFVAYAQLPATAVDYSRYLLYQVVESLWRPYSGPVGEQAGLHELASGLTWRVGESLRARIEWLARGPWEGPGDLNDYVNSLVNEILKRQDLSRLDPDLLRVMLFALRRDPATDARVYKYLRCENMNDEDRRCIGNVIPRTGSDDPSFLLGQLARLASATRQAVFVVMIDQAELAGFDGVTGTIFRGAVDALYRLVDEERSVIAVVSCLSDLYDQVRDQLIRSAVDRLERNPPIKRLQINRSYAEIQAIVARRLSWLFALKGAAHQSERPVYPIPEDQLRSLTNRRTRDVLVWCSEYHERCVDAGHVIYDTHDGGSKHAAHAPQPPDNKDVGGKGPRTYKDPPDGEQLGTDQGPKNKDPSNKEPTSKETATKEPRSKEPSTKESTSKGASTKDPTSKGPSPKNKGGKDPSAKGPTNKSSSTEDRDSKDQENREQQNKQVDHDEAAIDQIAAAWQQTLKASRIRLPTDEKEILAILATAAQSYADEAGLKLATLPGKDDELRLQFSNNANDRLVLVLAVANSGFGRGAFVGQIDALRKAAGNAKPIAIRTADEPRGEESERALERLGKDGGWCAYLEKLTFRTLVVSHRFQSPFPADQMMAWRRRARPISNLPGMAQAFGFAPPPTEKAPEPAKGRAKVKSARATSSGSRTGR